MFLCLAIAPVYFSQAMYKELIEEPDESICDSEEDSDSQNSESESSDSDDELVQCDGCRQMLPDDDIFPCEIPQGESKRIYRRQTTAVQEFVKKNYCDSCYEKATKKS